MEEEFGRRLREMRTQHRGPVSEQVLLGWYDSIRCELWKEELAHEQRHQGKILPSIHARYWSQYEVRVLLLGKQPNQEWTAELSRLIQAEMRLDESYRALRWYVTQVCPWTADDSPTEGFDYGGLGLLYWGLSKDPDFGSDLEWRLEDIMEYRERMLNISEVLWAQEDLEVLANQEWELEIAYRQLLDSAQQQVWAPFAWDYSDVPANSPKITADVLVIGQSNSVRCSSPPPAMEAELLWRMQQVLTHLDEPGFAHDELGWRNTLVQQPEKGTEDRAAVSSSHLLCTGSGEKEAILSPRPQNTAGMDLIDFSTEEGKPGEPPAAKLTLGPYFTELCSAPVLSSLCYGQEMVNFYPQAPVLETGDLLYISAEEEQPDELPAEVLATGQRVQNLCPTNAAVLEAQGEEVAVTPEQQIRIQGETVGTPQLLLTLVSGDLTVVSTDTNPAEALATGQNDAGLCPQLTEDGGPMKVDGTSVSTETTPGYSPALRQEDGSQALQALEDCYLATFSICIPQGCCAIGPDPQQHDGVSPATLTSLQQQQGLQAEGPVYISSQQQVCSMREAEVGWVSNTVFGSICLGYCVGTDNGGLKLLTNFGVNPFGVSSYVSPLRKGEICDGSHFGWGTCGTQDTSARFGGSWSSSLRPSYV